MIVILKDQADKRQVGKLMQNIESLGIKIHYSEGEHTTILGLVGDTSAVDINALRASDIVQDVRRISEPYKAANRRFHPLDTIVDVAGVKAPVTLP